jgi:hypothetical protein
MTRLGTERKSAGRMPAVLETAEESIRLMRGLLDQGKKKRAVPTALLA